MSAARKPGAKAGAPGEPGKAGSNTRSSIKDESELLLGSALGHNTKTLAQMRTFSAIVAGIVAGLLKFENLAGFAVLLFITFLHSFMIAIKMGGNVTRHFQKPQDVFVQQLGSGIMTFILFWTLAYDIVHIF
eukprot:gnl/MRDRNA2_/MRDRNA2_77694_c0_seq1.p1 gnl/MRDRNA2_/MRDRNA2_77694_c0~~gnl/MRDRNA2_/MRDRNA2_77694_c0_seq1.p1  ORF type:complete len:132 (-),score=30.79 gnl/MRDRNA2_/MRDRNA2_77694_c0_seq1:191-586(-)